MASTSRDKPVRNTKKHENTKGLSNISQLSETQLIKIEFNEKLHEHFLSMKNVEESSIISNLWSRKSVESMIQNIKKEEEKSRLDSSYINIYRNTYKIVECRDGKKRLFFKDEDVKLKLILPWEDMFDIFWVKHLEYGHPSAESLKIELKHDYLLNDFAIQSLSEVCYTCGGPQKPYYRCTLDFLTLKSTDYAFSHIMMYQDMYSGFIHLRPICADNMESEICVELFRIFMDFGPPKEVVVSDEIFIKALDQIKHLTTFAPIPIKITKVAEDVLKISSIRRKIRAWMTQNNFENWGIALYGVQLYLNNYSKKSDKSPYDMVFKKLPTSVVEDLTDVEFDSFAFASSSDVTVVEKEIPAASLATSVVEDLTDVEFDSSSDVRVVDKGVSAAPLATSVVDDLTDVEFDSSSDVRVVEKEISAASLTTSVVEDLTDVEFDSSSDVRVVDKGVSAALTIDLDAMSSISGSASASPDSQSTEVHETEEIYTAFETEFNTASEDEMIKSEDEDPLAID